jgi:hypothetical protein
MKTRRRTFSESFVRRNEIRPSTVRQLNFTLLAGGYAAPAKGQDARSIDDRVRRCRAFAEARGLAVVDGNAGGYSRVSSGSGSLARDFAMLRVGPTAPSRTVIPDVLRDIQPIVRGRASRRARSLSAGS